MCGDKNGKLEFLSFIISSICLFAYLFICKIIYLFLKNALTVREFSVRDRNNLNPTKSDSVQCVSCGDETYTPHHHLHTQTYFVLISPLFFPTSIQHGDLLICVMNL